MTPKLDAQMQRWAPIWELVKNNAAASRWSARSAALFIIYIEDSAHDYQAINDRAKLTQRKQLQIAPETHARNEIQIKTGKIDPGEHGKNIARTWNYTKRGRNNNNNICRRYKYNIAKWKCRGANQIKRLPNYSIIAKTRKAKIRWGKVHIVTRKQRVGN